MDHLRAKQCHFTVWWVYFITFRNYMVSELVGRGGDCRRTHRHGAGNGPNTMANEKAVMAEHGFPRWVASPACWC
ncbi:MAG: hypothetical protein ACLR0P_05715 [Oscillospiraceae bacterium]